MHRQCHLDHSNSLLCVQYRWLQVSALSRRESSSFELGSQTLVTRGGAEDQECWRKYNDGKGQWRSQPDSLFCWLRLQAEQEFALRQADDNMQAWRKEVWEKWGRPVHTVWVWWHLVEVCERQPGDGGFGEWVARKVDKPGEDSGGLDVEVDSYWHIWWDWLWQHERHPYFHQQYRQRLIIAILRFITRKGCIHSVEDFRL